MLNLGFFQDLFLQIGPQINESCPNRRMIMVIGVRQMRQPQLIGAIVSRSLHIVAGITVQRWQV